MLTSQALSTQFNWRMSPVYHTERPPLCRLQLLPRTFGTTFEGEVPLFLEIPELLSDTVYDKPRVTTVPRELDPISRFDTNTHLSCDRTQRLPR